MTVQQKSLGRIIFVVCGAIGIAGAFGQSSILHNTLVHSYPFKMMGMPPAEFYRWIGNMGFYVSIVAAFIATMFSRKSRKLFVTVVPVIVCPFVYWVFFEIAFMTSPYEGQMMREPNFEGYTGLTARYEFGFNVLALLFWGGVIGLASGYLAEKISLYFGLRVEANAAK